ncbi:MAG: alpha-amylase family protein [Nocardioides sp.]|nr:alpha-amylase family protein [Nocardioides sp.]
MPAPPDPEDSTTPAWRATLAGLSEDRRVAFEVRLERWLPDLRDGLLAAYGDQVTPSVVPRLVALAATAYAARSDALHRRDLERTLRPDWLQDPSMVGYAAYTERFAGDLPGVRDRIGYLRELGVTYLHLMPLLTPREGDSDGGYAVADHTTVRADLGTMADLAETATALHEAGISLVLDLVVNHVAREHPWAVKARAGDPRYRDYFLLFADRTEPDRFEEALPEVFPEFAPGSFTWDDELDAWVWTTFNAWQWDVSWANPDVLCEFAGIVLDLANTGVDVFRLDAIAFIWKRLGTDSQGQPEVHALTQALRAVARIACPAVALKAEAIVAPSRLLAYLGEGSSSGKVSDLAYHNSLMVQVWSMLASRDVRLAAQALSVLPAKPASATWLTYLRCHDDIGWAVMDDDATAVGLSGPLHRRFLSDWYAGDFPGSSARGLVFQHNPVDGDRRISGAAASLIGLEAAEEHRSGVLEAAAALRLAHALVIGFGGLPVIWSGDELGQANDPHWADEPGHDGDNRWAHRPRLDRDRAELRTDGSTAAGRVHTDLVHLLRTRATLPQLHGSVETRIGPVDDPGVLVTLREHAVGRFVGVHNVTSETRWWPGWRVEDLDAGGLVDALSGRPLERTHDGAVALAPYAVLWLV